MGGVPRQRCPACVALGEKGCSHGRTHKPSGSACDVCGRPVPSMERWQTFGPSMLVGHKSCVDRIDALWQREQPDRPTHLLGYEPPGQRVAMCGVLERSRLGERLDFTIDPQDVTCVDCAADAAKVGLYQTGRWTPHPHAPGIVLGTRQAARLPERLRVMARDTIRRALARLEQP